MDDFLTRPNPKAGLCDLHDHGGLKVGWKEYLFDLIQTVRAYPTPYALHPHPALYTLHTSHQTSNPKHHTLNPPHQTLDNLPYTLHPSPYTLHLLAFAILSERAERKREELLHRSSPSRVSHRVWVLPRLHTWC